MTKAELIERTIDAMVDPWTDCPEDYLYSTSIDLYEATDLLDQIRSDEQDMDLEPDEQLPQEVTPEIVMEAYNCHVRAMKYEARTERLAEWIKENDPVCEYCNYYLPEHDSNVDVIPVDFLSCSDYFPFMNNATPLDILCIGMNSRKTFDPQDEFCWFDSDTMTLHSTAHPFGDGILDAEDFARFILLDADCFGYMFDDIIDDEDAKRILGCTKEEYINE